jgi:hypothetical protein
MGGPPSSRPGYGQVVNSIVSVICQCCHARQMLIVRLLEWGIHDRWLGAERHMNGHARAVTMRGPNGDPAAEEIHPLSHADETEADVLVICQVEPYPTIGDMQVQHVERRGETNGRRSGMAVSNDIVQGFLHDPEDTQLNVWRNLCSDRAMSELDANVGPIRRVGADAAKSQNETQQLQL